MARKYKQGKFVPLHPEKYVGKVADIFYRSSWELKIMKWADNNPAVLNWSSEELVVPYISPVDLKPHRYFIDFVIKVQTRSGETKSYAVEVKPDAQTKKPRKTKNLIRLAESTATYMINTAKWEAADAYCKKIGLEFIVLTEKDLF